MPKHFYLDDSTFDLTSIGIILDVTVLLLLIIYIIVCPFTSGNYDYFPKLILSECESFTRQGLPYYFILAFIPILDLFHNVLKFRIKKKFRSNRIPVISIYEDGIEIPFLLQNRILFSELKSIEYEEGFSCNNLLVETHECFVLQRNSSWSYLRQHYNKENSKLNWCVPKLDKGTNALARVVIEIQKKIGN